MPISKKWLLLIAAVIFALFIFYSYLVAKERFTQLDFDLTVKFQDRIPRKLDYPFSILSVMGRAEITMALWALLSIYLLFKRFWLATLAMMLLPLALAIEVFGKVFVLHPAPPYLFYRGVIKFDFPTDFIHTEYSYPSGHMTRTAFLVVFVMTYFYLRAAPRLQLLLQPVLTGLIIIMGISRIYLGEHWTSDVIGGTLIGISFGLLAGICLPKKNLHPVTDHS